MYTGDPIKLEHIKDQSFYNIDHIYPQSMVKDDSLDNKVLVQSEINGEKSSRYPLDAAIRNKMKPLWDAYYNHGLISLKKYQRLTRSTPLQMMKSGISSIGSLLRQDNPRRPWQSY